MDGVVVTGCQVNGLLAFVVPGSDPYSVAQGHSTADPGGVDAGVLPALIGGLDLASPPPPPFPSTSVAVSSAPAQSPFHSNISECIACR